MKAGDAAVFVGSAELRCTQAPALHDEAPLPLPQAEGPPETQPQAPSVPVGSSLQLPQLEGPPAALSGSPAAPPAPAEQPAASQPTSLPLPPCQRPKRSRLLPPPQPGAASVLALAGDSSCAACPPGCRCAPAVFCMPTAPPAPAPAAADACGDSSLAAWLEGFLGPEIDASASPLRGAATVHAH